MSSFISLHPSSTSESGGVGDGGGVLGPLGSQPNLPGGSSQGIAIQSLFFFIKFNFILSYKTNE